MSGSPRYARCSCLSVWIASVSADRTDTGRLCGGDAVGVPGGLAITDPLRTWGAEIR